MIRLQYSCSCTFFRRYNPVFITIMVVWTVISFAAIPYNFGGAGDTLDFLANYLTEVWDEGWFVQDGDIIRAVIWLPLTVFVIAFFIASLILLFLWSFIASRLLDIG